MNNFRKWGQSQASAESRWTGPFFYKYLLTIILISFLVSFLGMWKIPIERTQEARVAVTAREALKDGNWFIPTLNGIPRLKKPPLMTWIVAGSYCLFDTVNEFSARFPSFVFSLLAVIVMFFFGKRLFNKRAGFITSLVLATSFQFIKHSRLAEIDMALVLSIVLAAFFWYIAFSSDVRKTYMYLAGYFMCAVAVNLKGPAGFVLPFLSFLCVLLVLREFKEIKKWLNPISLLICLILSSLWYAMAALRESGLAAGVFKNELEIAFVKGIDHPGPFYYYFYTLFKCFAPWTVFMYWGAGFAFFKKEKNQALVFTLVWLVVSFILLSVNPNKQPHYSLLLLPPMALVTGWFADFLIDRKKVGRVVIVVISMFVLCVISGAILDSFFLHMKFYPNSSFKNLAMEIKRRGIGEKGVYTYDFHNAELVFYLGKKIPRLTVGEIENLEKEGENFYVILRAEKTGDILSGSEIFSYRYDEANYVVREF